MKISVVSLEFVIRTIFSQFVFSTQTPLCISVRGKQNSDVWVSSTDPRCRWLVFKVHAKINSVVLPTNVSISPSHEKSTDTKCYFSWRMKEGLFVEVLDRILCYLAFLFVNVEMTGRYCRHAQKDERWMYKQPVGILQFVSRQSARKTKQDSSDMNRKISLGILRERKCRIPTLFWEDSMSPPMLSFFQGVSCLNRSSVLLARLAIPLTATTAFLSRFDETLCDRIKNHVAYG